MAEALLEECLLENMDLLRKSTPLMENTQPRLSKAKGYLNAVLSRGRLTVSPVFRTRLTVKLFHVTLLSCLLFFGCCFAAQIFEWGAAADGKGALRAGSLSGRSGHVRPGGPRRADTGRSAHLPPPPAGRGVRHQRYARLNVLASSKVREARVAYSSGCTHYWTSAPQELNLKQKDFLFCMKNTLIKKVLQ